MSAETDIDRKESSKGSPPVVTQFMALIFGEHRPDPYTLITFYINLFFWSCFLLWSFASYLTLRYRELITEQKKISVELIIGGRGEELGFGSEEFVGRLETLYAVQLVCLVVVFFGIILLYRKNVRFIYFLAGGMISYTGMQLFYISLKYFSEDVTLFDKTALLTMLASSTLYWFLLKKESSGGSINFFDEEEAVE